MAWLICLNFVMNAMIYYDLNTKFCCQILINYRDLYSTIQHYYSEVLLAPAQLKRTCLWLE